MPPQTDVHSFLFADIVGFTALMSARGDEFGADMALDLQHAARFLALECGADFVKGMGDAVMVHGDDAGQTVCLGLRLVDELLAEDPGRLLRVGVHTGPAIAREGDWYGTTVNLAARLAAHARGGEVLISDSTYRSIAAAGALDLVNRGSWCARGARSHIQIFEARSTSGRDSGLVATAV